MFKANHVRTSPLGLIQGLNFSDDAHYQENTVLGGIHQGRTEMSSNIIQYQSLHTVAMMEDHLKL